jgi:APA family basic amino acid/polyamine antiporter
MLSFVSVPLVIIGTMTVVSVFVFRKKQPDLPRPYRCWGYPVVPALYVAIACCMMYVKFVQRSNEFVTIDSLSLNIPVSYLSLIFFLLGIPVYHLWKRVQAH